MTCLSAQGRTGRGMRLESDEALDGFLNHLRWLKCFDAVVL